MSARVCVRARSLLCKRRRVHTWLPGDQLCVYPDEHLRPGTQCGRAAPVPLAAVDCRCLCNHGHPISLHMQSIPGVLWRRQTSATPRRSDTYQLLACLLACMPCTLGVFLHGKPNPAITGGQIASRLRNEACSVPPCKSQIDKANLVCRHSVCAAP